MDWQWVKFVLRFHMRIIWMAEIRSGSWKMWSNVQTILFILFTSHFLSSSIQLTSLLSRIRCRKIMYQKRFSRVYNYFRMKFLLRLHRLEWNAMEQEKRRAHYQHRMSRGNILYFKLFLSCSNPRMVLFFLWWNSQSFSQLLFSILRFRSIFLFAYRNGKRKMLLQSCHLMMMNKSRWKEQHKKSP